MYIFKTVVELQQYLSTSIQNGKKIGFIPTMGALHAGHLSLINHSKAENDISVCSIFVNPTQFDDKNDLSKYPRPIEADIEKLVARGCEVSFLPNAAEVYPADLISPDFDLNGLDLPMEGAIRKGHFAGVVQVVHRLLDIVKPHSLYIGQKDYQQFTIIKHMLKLMDSPIQLVRVATEREEDGLAMSSRNVRLTPEGRARAKYISQTLFQAKVNAATMSLEATKDAAVKKLKEHGLEIDYFNIVNGDTLQDIEEWNAAAIVTACVVCKVDGVRLLDNIVLKECS